MWWQWIGSCATVFILATSLAHGQTLRQEVSLTLPRGSIESPPIVLTESWSRCVIEVTRDNMLPGDTVEIYVIEVATGRIVGGATIVPTITINPLSVPGTVDIPCDKLSNGMEVKLHVDSSRSFGATLRLRSR